MHDRDQEKPCHTQIWGEVLADLLICLLRNQDEVSRGSARLDEKDIDKSKQPGNVQAYESYNVRHIYQRGPIGWGGWVSFLYI